MPGGKGVNIARALKRLGQPVIATGLAGGATGNRIIDALNDEKYADPWTPGYSIDPKATQQVADLIAANGPVAVQAVLHSLRETEGVPEDEALKIEHQIGREVFKTQDAKEGPRAFMEKSKPVFLGR